MKTKNLLDTEALARPEIFSDLTGKVTFDPRGDIADTLLLVHDTYKTILDLESRLEPLAIRFGMNAICRHMGWLPLEISAVEQYVTHYAAANTQEPAR